MHYVETIACTFEHCKRCDNNKGGCCAYDLRREAADSGKSLEEIVNQYRCLYFDPIENDDDDCDYDYDD